MIVPEHNIVEVKNGGQIFDRWDTISTVKKGEMYQIMIKSDRKLRIT